MADTPAPGHVRITGTDVPLDADLRAAFEDDAPDMTELRLKVNNLVGPAGFVSMEDGCVGGWVQKAAMADPHARTVLPMGGSAIEPSEGSRVTEAAVRGFWKGWRECMGV